MIIKESIKDLEAQLLGITSLNALVFGNENLSDFTLTFEEICHLATEEQESYLMHSIYKVLTREQICKGRVNKVELVSIEDAVFVGGKLISCELCYEDKIIYRITNKKGRYKVYTINQK